MIDALLAPFYKWIILALLVFILGYAWYANGLAGDLRKAQSDCDSRMAKAIKPFQDSIAKAQEQKAITEKAWSDKYIEVEKNAIKKIQDANATARSADLAASGLSKQLSEANKHLSSASKQTIINYTITNSELLEACTAEYRSMAEKADQHSLDAMRLSESWPEEKALK